MINKQFALGTYEFELQPKLDRQYILDAFCDKVKYIDTAIDYNNDYLLQDTRYKIISKISFCHYSNYEFFISNHLKCLNRDYIDIMLIHSNRGNWVELAQTMSKDTRFKEIGVSNFTKADIEIYKNATGRFPAYNEIEINPYYIDLDTIDFCKANNIKIIAYAILGGKYNSWRNIADFGLTNLIVFASKYADIIILRPNSIKETDEFIDVISHFSTDSFIKPIDFTNKAIKPMDYKLPPIKKYCCGIPIYHTACGKNNLYTVKNMTSVNIILPDFEMLGDYRVYLRYLYKQHYENTDTYYYDFLIGDDGYYYTVILTDENNNLTKVNNNSTIEVLKFELQSI